MTNAMQDYQALEKLAKKDLALALGASLLMPLIGYWYTGRWTQFFKLVLGGAVAGAILTVAFDMKSDQVFSTVGIFGNLIAMYDNYTAIQLARFEVAK